MGFLAEDTKQEGADIVTKATQVLAKETKARRIFLCYSILNPDAVHDDDEVVFFSELVDVNRKSHLAEELAILRKYIAEYICQPPNFEDAKK